MLETTRGDDAGPITGIAGGDAGDDGGSSLLAPRHVAGFVASLVVYGIMPPVLTGAAIWYANTALGVTGRLPLAAVGLAVGFLVFLTAFVADRGVDALTGLEAGDDASEPAAPPERGA